MVRKGPLLALAVLMLRPLAAVATTYYVRQTVGNDAHDGKSPETAWQHISKLSTAMHAGDTAYIGPGLYREWINLFNDATPENRITFIADTTGQHTGDPPGVVMITGAVPVDESVFAAHSAPGVYTASLPKRIIGVVEMDGDQFRYNKVVQTREYLVEKMAAIDVVVKFPSSYFYDEETKVLYIHTSDGNPPASHEIELVLGLVGIAATGKHHVTVIGFTFRHLGDTGVSFFEGSSDCMAINNTSYGNRIGIRVYSATNILLYGNTVFRNENSGVYFVKDSMNAAAVGNTAYENVKGVRLGSRSGNAVVSGNTAFDNLEAGIAIEEVQRVLVTGNRLVNNSKYQLLVMNGEYASESNCFANGAPEQVTAYFFPYLFPGPPKTLAEYQRAKQQDLSSRDGDCGPLPAKLDVHKLHAETMAYAERARKLLSSVSVEKGGEKASGEAESARSPEGEGTRGFRGWLKRLLGR